MNYLPELDEKLNVFDTNDFKIATDLLNDINSGQYNNRLIEERLLDNIRELNVARGKYDIEEN